MTTEQTVNIPLLRKAVEWAEAEAAKPEIDSQWRQESWFSSRDSIAADLLDDRPLDEACTLRERVAAHCGTAYCVAGYIGQMVDARYASTETVEDLHVAEFAANALGIPPKHAAASPGTLFFGGNSAEDVRRIAEDIAGERL